MPSTNPEPHRNPNTRLLDPVVIFTDKAIVPAGKQKGPAKAEPSEETPPAAPPTPETKTE